MNENKKLVRKQFISRIQNLVPEDKLRQEATLVTKLTQQKAWQMAKVIAVTMSQGFELNTMSLIKAAQAASKVVVIPRTLPKRKMEFVELNSATKFEKSAFGIQEPVNGQVYLPTDIDLIIVPGVAFTPNGHRLGFGGGYYDRYLARYKGQTISLALSAQVADEEAWPHEIFDIDIQQVLTCLDK